MLGVKKIISFLEKKLKKLNKWVKNYSFECQKEEIYFFKELKPSLISKILFYQNVLKIESTLPPGKKAKRKHYIKAINKLSVKTREDRDFFEYYRSRATYNDHKYFVRRPYKDIFRDDPMQLYFDSKISTSHEYQVAKLISSDMLVNYLERKIDEINQKTGAANFRDPVNYIWSGTKIDLVELIYALKHARLINNGNTDVKELATHLGKIFNIELEDNIYRIYQDIKLRKTVRTKFLNKLADNLNQKLDEEDL
ncbi:RteC domain-containing protein [Polaribacter sp. M15]